MKRQALARDFRFGERRISRPQLTNQRRLKTDIQRTPGFGGVVLETADASSDQWIVISHRRSDIATPAQNGVLITPSPLRCARYLWRGCGDFVERTVRSTATARLARLSYLLTLAPLFEPSAIPRWSSDAFSGTIMPR